MKRLAILLLAFSMLCFQSSIVSAQNDSESNGNNLVKELVKLKFPLAGVEWEKPIANRTVWILDGGMGAGFSFSKGSNSSADFYYRFAPYASTALRNYYNIERRLRKGRNIKNNAANFIELRATGYFPDVAASSTLQKSKKFGLSVMPSWGMQRSLSKNFNFEWYTGIGVEGNGDFSKIYPRFGLAFAFSYLLKK